MEPTRILRHKTAIHRSELSRPIRLAMEDGLIQSTTSVFDYGCGQGHDLAHLEAMGVPCAGWDPTFRPTTDKTSMAVVNLGYVVNVIEDQAERTDALNGAWALAQELLIVSARLVGAARSSEVEHYGDGVLTRRGTFQKFYEQHELRHWIEQTLGVPATPAGPGVFYIFRDEEKRQSYVASRYRRRIAAPRQRVSDVLYERHKPLFEALMAFVAWRGRVPAVEEMPEAPALIEAVGSIRRAFRIIIQVTEPTEWERIAEERAQDVLVHLALARFEPRPRFSRLAPELQRDVRAFFSSYKRACELADALLFSAGDLESVNQAIAVSSVGKTTGNAFYVHSSALPQLAPILRVYEGCARAYIGQVEGANLVKLHRRKPQVSYLSYPDFDKDPHPALAAALVVPLQTFRVRRQWYDDSANPPILHRKEMFVAPDYPGREKFARLTRQEERRGLYDDPCKIGTRDGWHAILEGRGLRVQGQRVVRARRAAG